jgi:hypothetical protein
VASPATTSSAEPATAARMAGEDLFGVSDIGNATQRAGTAAGGRRKKNSATARKAT